MTYTENFNLSLPSRNDMDVVDIDVLSNNFKVVDEILGRMHPVGSIWMSFEETNPGSMFGGTWVRVEGRFLLGASDKYPVSTTGGEETVHLDVENLPAHTHAQAGMHYGSGATAGNQWTANSSGDVTHYYVTDPTGGDIPHNNIPPYLAVYIWRRTA